MASLLIIRIETTERVLTGITWKLDAENSTYSEFQGGLALKDYFDHFTEHSIICLISCISFIERIKYG